MKRLCSLIIVVLIFGCSSPIDKVKNGKSCTDCDLRSADLSGLTLRNIDLSNSDLSNANLSETVFENVNLANANLNNADLTNIKTTYLDEGTSMVALERNPRQNKIQTSFFKADLSGANISKASLEYTFFQEADFTNANLTGAIFDSSFLQNANFTNANLTEATFKVGWFAEGANFTNAILIKTDFRSTELSKMIIQEINKTKILSKLESEFEKLEKRARSIPNIKETFEYSETLESFMNLIGGVHFSQKPFTYTLEQASRSGSLKAYNLLKNFNSESSSGMKDDSARSGGMGGGTRVNLYSAGRIISDWNADEDIYVHEYELNEDNKKLYGLYEYEYDLTQEEKQLLRKLANYYIEELFYVRDYLDDELIEKAKAQLEEYVESYHQQSLDFSDVNSCEPVDFDYTEIKFARSSSSFELIAAEQFLDQSLDQSPSIIEQYNIYEDCLRSAVEKFDSRFESLADSLIKITYELNIPRKKLDDAEQNRKNLLENQTKKYQVSLVSLLKEILEPDIERVFNDEETRSLAFNFYLEYLVKTNSTSIFSGGPTSTEINSFWERKRKSLDSDTLNCLAFTNNWYRENSKKERDIILKSLQDFLSIDMEAMMSMSGDEIIAMIKPMTLTDEFFLNLSTAKKRCVIDSAAKMIAEQ